MFSFHLWHFSGERVFALGADNFFRMGWLGVHLFYALSAFLLTRHVLKKNGGGYGGFYLRRFLRIFPAYWAQLLVLLLAGGFFALDPSHALRSWPEHLLMLFHLPPRFVQPLNGVWWTLPIEFAFYLLIPAMLWLLRRVGTWLFLALVVAETVIFRWLIFQAFGGQVSLIEQLPGVFSVFGMGMAAAWLLHGEARPLPAWAAGVAVLALAAWSALLLADVDGYWQGSTLLFIWGSVSAVLIAVLIAALFTVDRGPLVARLPVWFGEVSYGIYLWHLPVILGALKIMPALGNRFALLALATIPPTLLFAWLSYRLVERPAQSLGRLVLGRR